MGKIGTKRTKSFLRAKGPHNPPPKREQVNSSTYVESKFSLNQEKKDLPKDPEAGIRKLSPAVQTKMGYNSMSQKRMGLHQQKEERRFAQDRFPQDTALNAGGSRPMHQATTSQIDPLTGMPLQANAPQMGNFSGFNEIPMYDQSMNPGAITQKRNLDEYEAKVDGSAVTKPGMEFEYMAGNTANSPESEKNVKGADRLDRMAESGYYNKSYVDKRKKDADVTLTSTLNPAFKLKK